MRIKLTTNGLLAQFFNQAIQDALDSDFDVYKKFEIKGDTWNHSEASTTCEFGRSILF